jgi:hypothetical protein
MTAKIVVLTLAGFLALLRFHGETGQFFQAAAHLYVGGLLAWGAARKPRWFPWSVAGVLSVAEVIAFFTVPRGG